MNDLQRDGAVRSARRVHNPEVSGSNPLPAKKRFAYRNGQMTEITHEPKTVARWPMIDMGRRWNG